ncbi:MAG: hypothetical protein R3264_05200 [Anaerolineae bacterium]|nr:hypothetical protein [Anaerolineae bacterium]
MAPDNSRTEACGTGNAKEIDVTVEQAGMYGVLVRPWLDGTGNYSLVVQCLSGPC